MTRRVWIVADDYGLSPAVDDGILELLDQGRLSVTGCMTVFPDWPQEGLRLRARHAARAGLHLTLTDQPSLSGAPGLATEGKLPGMTTLLSGIATRRIGDAAIFAELDAQLARFEAAIGQPPISIDGHQHVHYLPPVRRWLKGLARRREKPLPWLRGAPVAKYSPRTSFAKMTTVRALASRFDAGMAAAGFAVLGPLAGFYDWHTGEDFVATVDHAIEALPDEAVLMVHPGYVDQTLRSRDMLTDTRPVELRYLASDTFARLIEANTVKIAAA